MKRKNIQKFFIVFILLLFILGACNKKSNYVARNVYWGMSQDEVIKSEEELEDSSGGIEYDENKYVYDNATMYTLPCSIIYDFNDNDKLNSLAFIFEVSDNNFKILIEELNNNYGKAFDEKTDTFGIINKWDVNNSIISLVYGNNEYVQNLTVLFNNKEDNTQ